MEGADLAVVDKGTGPPVVLVHGNASDLRTWEPLAVALGRRFRVLAYSRRHAWPNLPIPDETPDPIDRHVEDLAQIIRSRAGGPAHVVGHSWGGLVAMLAARRHRELLRSLVLIEPPALTLFTPILPSAADVIRLSLTRPRAAVAILRLAATGLRPARAAFRRGDDLRAIRAFGRAVMGRDYFADLPQKRLAQAWDNRGTERAQALFTGFPVVEPDEVARIDLPVLLLGAEESPALFGLVLDRLGRILPQASRVTIPAASHILHEDNPAATGAAIKAFLDRQPVA